jgi:hypothetical protein
MAEGEIDWDKINKAAGIDTHTVANEQGTTRETDPHDSGEIPAGGVIFQASEASNKDVGLQNIFGPYADPTNQLANERKEYIEIYHIPTGLNVFFKAFLTEFSDTFSPEYNEEAVFGRMDPIATYKRTGRKIQLGWSMPSSDLNEAKENMAKMNRFIQMLYPVYDKASEGGSSATTMRSGPIFKIKMGNLIMKPGQKTTSGAAKKKGLPGIISGFSYSPDLDAGVFDPPESTRTEPGIQKRVVGVYEGNIYPKSITVSISITVLHDTPLGFEVFGEDEVRLRNETADMPARFPYGGDNKQTSIIGKPFTYYVKQADWASYLDVQGDLMKRRVEMKANKLLAPINDARKFFNV